MTADLDRLASVVQHTTNAALITDRDRRIVWVNAGFTRLTGYCAAEAIGRTPAELLQAGGTDPAALRTLSDAVAAGTACRIEVLNRRKDGSDCWVETEIQPTRDEHGEVTGFIEFAFDITTEKNTTLRLAAALRDNEALLKTLNMHAIVSVADRKGEIIDVNDAFCRISGYARHELLGRSHRIVNSGVQPRAFWTDMWRTIARGQPWRGEVCNRAKDGALYWVDSIIAPFRGADGRIEKYISIRTDITRFKALQEEIRRSNELLRSVLDNLPCGLSVFDGELRLRAENRQFRALLDFPDHLFAGEVTRFEDLIGFNARRGEYGAGDPEEFVAEIVGRARHPVPHQFERARPDGTTLEVRGAPMPGGGFVTTYFDVSERRRALDALRELNEELAQARDHAEAAAAAKSAFLANTSHEIRTPMNAVLGMLQLLQRTELTPRQLDYATKSEAAARTLLQILNDILDFSKVEAGKMTLDAQPFRIDRLLHNLAVIVSANAGDKDIEVLFDIDPALPRALLGDALRLQQVLINLAGNAIKFTPQGEVVVRIAVAERRDETVLLDLSVRDTGIGIAPEHQAKIFTGFTQAEASTTRRFGGTGLGLSISRHLVALMGGELKLQSEFGAGSRFYFRIELPIARADDLVLPEAQSPAAADRARRLAGMRLLLVEDNANNRQVARELLEDEGALVELAGNGVEGVAAVAAAAPPFDAVLMDLQMPVMDGYTATAQIRRRLERTDLPIIAMTANAMASDREACLAAGMNDHVGKPIDLGHLVAVLLKATGRGAPASTNPSVELPAGLVAEAAAQGIDLAAALNRLGGKTSVYRNLARQFIAEVTNAPDQLADQLRRGERAQAQQAMHTLKGLAATLGIRALAALAADAETACAAAANAQSEHALIARLHKSIDAAAVALTWLDALLDRAARPCDDAPRRLDAAALRGALDELAELAASSDMRALEVHERLRRECPPGDGAWRSLDEAIAALDFERAAAECATLKNNLRIEDRDVAR